MIVSVFVNLCLPPKHFRTKIGKVWSAAWEILCIMRWRELCHRLKTWKSRSYLPTARPVGWSKSRWCALGLDKPRFKAGGSAGGDELAVPRVENFAVALSKRCCVLLKLLVILVIFLFCVAFVHFIKCWFVQSFDWLPLKEERELTEPHSV